MRNYKTQQLNPKILQSADKCNIEYRCNSEDWKDCGKIGESVSGLILHIAFTENEKMAQDCDYHLPFGGDHYCTCPARMYIYKNFGV